MCTKFMTTSWSPLREMNEGMNDLQVFISSSYTNENGLIFL